LLRSNQGGGTPRQPLNGIPRSIPSLLTRDGRRTSDHSALGEGGVRADEKAALAVAAGRGFSDVVRVVEGVHRAVLARAYGFLGASGRAPRRAHEGFTAGIY